MVRRDENPSNPEALENIAGNLKNTKTISKAEIPESLRVGYELSHGILGEYTIESSRKKS